MQSTGASSEASAADVAAAMLELWRSILAGSTKSLYALLAELDLSMTQMKMLHVLAERREEISVKELAEELGMSLANASRTIDGLLQRGYVERREDEHDRRVRRVGATAAAREVVDRIDTARLQGLEAWAQRLGPEQRTRLHDALCALPKEDRA
ncbi:MarR family transcriptional regulator [Baekduia soli]|uniref:MarR family transcriptional regulator n=1 Tax=Baekduia soli TaxID=496014 RepID=A0A5B8U4W2_9ACTN|nr:MarR family transcriptional regulator [Baekduia soli]QEC48156.1 MarR family transcriptional regulator [Baekduia soli]